MAVTTKKIKSPFPEQYTDKQWAGYVSEGRDLVEQETRIQFALGDLTLRMIKAHPHDGDHGVFRVLDRFADEIGIPFDTLRTYRHEAIAWPKGKRARGVSYSIHRALDACKDRDVVIRQPPKGMDRWTLDAALRYAERTPKTPESKREKVDRVRSILQKDQHAAAAVDDLIRRPRVAEKVMANPSSRRVLYQANVDRFRDRAERGRSAGYAEQERPAVQRESLVEDTPAARQVLEVLGLGTSYYTGMQDLIPHLRVAEFSDRAKRTIVENNRRVRAVADWCDTVIATGDTTMDEQLHRLLEGGDSP